ncbi:MAG TPA: hypothetical protein VF960_02410 [Chloroflexota bacterium]
MIAFTTPMSMDSKSGPIGFQMAMTAGVRWAASDALVSFQVNSST